MNQFASYQKKSASLWVMMCYSTLVHLLLFILILKFHFPTSFKEAPTYYVDLVALPVAKPQAGTPAAQGELKAPPAPARPAPAAPKAKEMVLPSKPSKVPTPPKQHETEDSGKAFAERMEKMERDAAARHESAAIDALRKRVGSRGPVGMPGATGNEAGSDYTSYIRSRLEDAFRTTIAFESSRPEVLVKLTINANGRLARQQILKSTRDRIFEDSVYRAIAKAEKDFPPPPDHRQLEIDVKFTPKGIGKR